MTTRKSLSRRALRLLAAALVVPAAALGAGLILDPGWVEGTVTLGAYHVNSINVSAYGNGYSSSKSTAENPYSLTVQGGAWNYSVNASVYVTDPTTYYPYAYLSFPTRTLQVPVGARVANDYDINVGTIRFELLIDGDPYSYWSASYSAYKYDPTLGQYTTNSSGYHYSYYEADGKWDFPVVAGTDISLSAYVYVDGTPYGFNQTVTVGEGGTVVVPLVIHHVKPVYDPPPPPGPTPTYGTVTGSLHLQDLDPARLYYNYVSGAGSSSGTLFANPATYTLRNAYPGQSYLVPSTSYDRGYGSLQWPYLANLVNVQAGATLTKDIVSRSGTLDLDLKFTGTMKGAPIYSKSVSVPGVSNIYDPATRQWVQQPTYGGSGSASRNRSAHSAAELAAPMSFVLTPGAWNPYSVSVSTEKVVSGYSVWNSLGITDYNYYYDGISFPFAKRTDVVAGQSTPQNRDYCTGSVVVRFSVAGGGVLNYPRLYGNGYLRAASGQTEMYANSSGYTYTWGVPDPEIEVHGPDGDYTFYPYFVTADGTNISYRPISVKLVCPDKNIINLDGPIVTIATPPGNLITNAATVQVSGTATDDTGVQSVTIDGNPVSITPGQTVSFTYQLTVPDGTHTILTTATDISGNVGTSNRTILVDRWAPTVTIGQPLQGAVFAPTASIPVTVSATDRGFGYGMTVKLDGQVIGQKDGAADEAAPTSLALSSALTALARGTHTIEAVVTDKAGNAATATATFRVNTPPTVAVAPATQTVHFRDPIANVTISAGDVDGDALTITTSALPAGLVLSAGACAGTCTATISGQALVPVGTYPITVTVSDGNESAPAVTTLVVTNTPPTLALSPASQTVQYSDEAKFTIAAADVDGDPLTFTTSALPGGLVLDAALRTISGPALVPAGSYPITVTVSDGLATATASATLVVTQEDASVVFADANAAAVKVATAGGTSPAFSLTVGVKETLPDLAAVAARAGDINRAVVSMSLVPIGPGATVNGACAPTASAGTGYQTLNVSCSFSGLLVNVYSVIVTVNGSYYAGSGEDLVTVFDPSLGFATGGGWFYWPGTTDRTNFGFTSQYGQNGINAKGNVLMVRHRPDGSIYRVKSNAMTGISLSAFASAFGWASMTGKATYQEPGWPLPLGNHTFVLYVEDRNEPGTGVDKVWIQVKDPAGKIMGNSSMASPSGANAVTLGGGNIAVPHQG